jgi:hypothetical protein
MFLISAIGKSLLLVFFLRPSLPNGPTVSRRIDTRSQSCDNLLSRQRRNDKRLRLRLDSFRPGSAVFKPSRGYQLLASPDVGPIPKR